MLQLLPGNIFCIVILKNLGTILFSPYLLKFIVDGHV